MTAALPGSPPQTGRRKRAAGKQPLVTGQSRPIGDIRNPELVAPKQPVVCREPNTKGDPAAEVTHR